MILRKGLGASPNDITDVDNPPWGALSLHGEWIGGRMGGWCGKWEESKQRELKLVCKIILFLL